MRRNTGSIAIFLIVAIGGSLGIGQTSLGDDPRDLVIHAAGSVEFRLPLGWRLSEVAAGREVRLLMTPGKLPNHPTALFDGAWIVHHRRDRSDPAFQDLRKTLAARLLYTRSNDRLEVKPIQEITLAGKKGLRQPFLATVSQAGKTIQIRGYHLLAITGDGLFETQFVAPVESYADQAAEMERSFQTLIIAAPAKREDKLQEAWIDAKPILGSWKSVRSRMVIRGNGELLMQFDHQGAYPIEDDGRLRYEKKISRLVGQYESRDDLLLVTWADGSRTNYRWRLDRGDLLLTDHTGRVSQLRALFE